MSPLKLRAWSLNINITKRLLHRNTLHEASLSGKELLYFLVLFRFSYFPMHSIKFACWSLHELQEFGYIYIFFLVPVQLEYLIVKQLWDVASLLVAMVSTWGLAWVP